MELLGHFDGIVPCLACILTKQHGVRNGKSLLKTPTILDKSPWAGGSLRF